MAINSSKSDKWKFMLDPFAVVVQDNGISKVFICHPSSRIGPKDISYWMPLDKLHGIKECWIFSLHAFNVIQKDSNTVLNAI
uniref:Uncharacterized protein n=1 Tax=Arundo donax TaxID=35708 RepID=A0A0A9DBI7_ARUDO